MDYMEADMDIVVLIIAIFLTAGIFIYFITSYRNQRLTPQRVNKLKKEFYDAMIESGVKSVYEGLDDVPLMDAYKELDGLTFKKGQIVKTLEVACKKQIILEIFNERGVELAE